MAEHGPITAQFTARVELSAEEMASIPFLFQRSTVQAWIGGVILYNWNGEKKAWRGTIDGLYARVKKDGTLYDEKRRQFFYGSVETERLIERYKPTGIPDWRIIEGESA